MFSALINTELASLSNQPLLDGPFLSLPAPLPKKTEKRERNQQGKVKAKRHLPKRASALKTFDEHNPLLISYLPKEWEELRNPYLPTKRTSPKNKINLYR